MSASIAGATFPVVRQFPLPADHIDTGLPKQMLHSDFYQEKVLGRQRIKVTDLLNFR